MDEKKIVTFDSDRRFGGEFEILSFDKRDFKANPLDRDHRELPMGIEDVAILLAEGLRMNVAVNGWHHTHNNFNNWVLKPDSSAGIEICSPVLKGWQGIAQICHGVELMRSHPKVAVDDRCGFHVHMEVADMDMVMMGKIIAYWIKCEPVFMDSVPGKRKVNKYCQQIGLSPELAHNTEVDPIWLVDTYGQMKYYSLNTYHFKKGNRNTMEFRIIEGAGCLDPYLVKNWIRLLVHFVECVKELPLPPNYQKDNPMSGLLWLDPIDVLRILKLDGDLSKGLEETRNWFVARLWDNIYNSKGQFSVWSEPARQFAHDQVSELIRSWGYTPKDLCAQFLHPKDMGKALYSRECIV